MTALRWLEISALKDGVVAVSGCCDLGSLPPTLPGAFSWNLLRALASPEETVLAEIVAGTKDLEYYLDSGLPQRRLPRTPLDRLVGQRLLIGTLRPEAAPHWFEQTELLRGYLADHELTEAVADQVARKRPAIELLETATLQFELHYTKSLLVRSNRIPGCFLAQEALRVANEMSILAKCEEALLYPKFPKIDKKGRASGRNLYDRFFHKLSAHASGENPRCSTSSLLR